VRHLEQFIWNDPFELDDVLCPDLLFYPADLASFHLLYAFACIRLEFNKDFTVVLLLALAMTTSFCFWILCTKQH